MCPATFGAERIGHYDGGVSDSPDHPQNRETPLLADDVRAAYRLFLGREPESAEAVAEHLRHHHTRRELIDTFLAGDEFLLLATPRPRRRPEGDGTQLQTFFSHWRRPVTRVPAELWCDPLGVLTDISLSAEWADRAGRTVDDIAPGDAPEWQVLAEALEAAGESFCAVELGAGHAPWLVRAGVAWRTRRGDAPLRLVGVEGEPAHARAMREHARRNGLVAAELDLREGAVSVRDGSLRFEVVPQPNRDRGSRIVGEPSPVGLPRVVGAAQREVPCWSLATLLAPLSFVDLLHVDLQGSESAVLLAAGESLKRRVRRLFIGTHGRAIEDELMGTLPTLGFRLRDERACRFQLDAGIPTLCEDGAQSWLNTNLPAAPSATIPMV